MLDGDGLEALGRSAAQLDDIAERLDSPLLAPLRFMPIAGRQLSAASHQADAAAAAGSAPRSTSATSSRTSSTAACGRDPERVAALREVEQVASRGPRPRSRTSTSDPSDALIGPLNTSRTRIEEVRDEALDLLESGGRTRAAAWPRSSKGPTDYLLLAANNAQMQNGQGMFLSAGVLHVEDGRMDLDVDGAHRAVPRGHHARPARSRPGRPMGVARSERRLPPPRALAPVPGDGPDRRRPLAGRGTPAGRRRDGGRPVRPAGDHGGERTGRDARRRGGRRRRWSSSRCTTSTSATSTTRAATARTTEARRDQLEHIADGGAVGLRGRGVRRARVRGGAGRPPLVGATCFVVVAGPATPGRVGGGRRRRTDPRGLGAAVDRQPVGQQARLVHPLVGRPHHRARRRRLRRGAPHHGAQRRARVGRARLRRRARTRAAGSTRASTSGW